MRSGAVLEFEVTDDGIGFTPATTPRHSGLINVIDRLGSVGGDFAVASEGGHGTHLIGMVPALPLT